MNMRSGKDLDAGSAHQRKIDFDGIDNKEGIITAEFLRVASRWVVVWCALEQIGAYAAHAGQSWVRGSAWLRTNSAPQFTSDRPAQAHEGIAIMHSPGKKRWNWHGGQFAPVGTTLSGSACADKVKSLAHPTPKPEWLMIQAIDAFTLPDDVVLDPFCGSGTTGVACLRLGRRFVGFELNPSHAQTTRERLAAEESGSTLQARRAGQGSLFG
jgi:site-specific DNA-methyltransferase (adenine-specific)